MTTFACQPQDFESLPWVPGCAQCVLLHEWAEPDLFSWVEAVGEHFDSAHGIFLVGA